MSGIQKGSEIILKVFPRSWVNNNAYNDLRKELEYTVVVPEEKWEGIKTLIENRPKCPIKYGEVWKSQGQETDYIFEIEKWFVKLRKAMENG